MKLKLIDWTFSKPKSSPWLLFADYLEEIVTVLINKNHQHQHQHQHSFFRYLRNIFVVSLWSCKNKSGSYYKSLEEFTQTQAIKLTTVKTNLVIYKKIKSKSLWHNMKLWSVVNENSSLKVNSSAYTSLSLWYPTYLMVPMKPSSMWFDRCNHLHEWYQHESAVFVITHYVISCSFETK